MDSFTNLKKISYAKLRSSIRSGDILFASGNSTFSRLIQHSTKSHWSHVAFILKVNEINRIMVLESVESIGVRTVPLSHYFSDYNGTGKAYPGTLMLARHTDLIKDKISQLSRTAINLLGYPYNTNEIVRIAMRISMHNLGLKTPAADPIYKKSFICSEYVYLCFNSIGIKIDYDPLGFIAPCDFADCPKIKPIDFIKNTSRAMQKKSYQNTILENQFI